MNNKIILILYTFVLGVLLVSSCSVFRSESENQDKIDTKDLVKRGIIPEGYIAVEKEPVIDITRILKCTVYPEQAKGTGIEGRVVIRILIQKDGKVTEKVIEESDNTIFNDAAYEAIDCYGDFTTAIQDGKPIACWVSLPIIFKLDN